MWRTWGVRTPLKPRKNKKAYNPDINRMPVLQLIKRGQRIRTHLNQMVSRKIGAEKYAFLRVIYGGELVPIDDAKEILGL